MYTNLLSINYIGHTKDTGVAFRWSLMRLGVEIAHGYVRSLLDGDRAIRNYYEEVSTVEEKISDSRFKFLLKL